MTLSAEALRLAAIEVICPSKDAADGNPLPTLAGKFVYDSRGPALEDLDRRKQYTPVLSLYTPKSGLSLRGDAAGADDTVVTAELEIVAELAIIDTEANEEFVDAMAETDPEARLVLAALCAQVRYLLDRSVAGGLWRHLVSHIVSIDEETHAVPQFGLRYNRVFMRIVCQIRDDDFSDGGLPQPIAGLYAALPEESYAKGKLAALASHFTADSLPDLEGVSIAGGGAVPGSGIGFP